MDKEFVYIIDDILNLSSNLKKNISEMIDKDILEENNKISVIDDKQKILYIKYKKDIIFILTFKIKNTQIDINYIYVTKEYRKNGLLRMGIKYLLNFIKVKKFQIEISPLIMNNKSLKFKLDIFSKLGFCIILKTIVKLDNGTYGMIIKKELINNDKTCEYNYIIKDDKNKKIKIKPEQIEKCYKIKDDKLIESNCKMITDRKNLILFNKK